MLRRLLAACALAAPAFLSAQEKFPVAPATLSLVLSTTRSEPDKPGKNGEVIYSATRQTVRIGNADILEAMRAAGDISEVRGWAIVAIWNYSSEVGEGYRFFARRVRGREVETVPVATSLLNLEAHESGAGASAYRIVFAPDLEAPKSGSKKFDLLNRVTFALGPYEGQASGILTGAGEYVRLGRESESRYKSGSARVPLQGVFTNQSENRMGVVNGSLSFGTSKFLHLETPENSAGGSTGPTFPDVDTSITVSVN